MNEGAPAIRLDGITKRYGTFTAVDGISLELHAGSVCGLLGPNGAGKTTTFKCLLGFARPDAGTIAFDGLPLRPATFETLGFVPERPALYEWLTVADHLALRRRTHSSYDGARAHELLGRFSLDPNARVRSLSKGMRGALSLVLAFAIVPRILILDEPASGLDPIHQRQVLDLIIEAAANGACVVFSSHQVAQVERAADRIAILNRGRLVLDRELDELKTTEKIVEAIFAGEPPAVEAIAADPRVVRIERSGSMLRVVTRADVDGVAADVFALRPRSLRIIDLNLEEIFLNAVAEGTR